MPLDPEALLTIAVDLVTARPGGASEQSCWRTAMNRSYYACLLLLIKRIDQVNGAGTVPPYNTHHWVRVIRRHCASAVHLVDALDQQEQAGVIASIHRGAPAALLRSATGSGRHEVNGNCEQCFRVERHLLRSMTHQNEIVLDCGEGGNEVVDQSVLSIKERFQRDYGRADCHHGENVGLAVDIAPEVGAHRSCYSEKPFCLASKPAQRLNPCFRPPFRAYRLGGALSKRVHQPRCRCRPHGYRVSNCPGIRTVEPHLVERSTAYVPAEISLREKSRVNHIPNKALRWLGGLHVPLLGQR